MSRSFPETLSALRKQRNISQRSAAADLNISQALLSHYENGAREPGLAFVYYSVSADFILGRTDEPDGVKSTADAARAFIGQLRAMADRAEMALDEFTGRTDGETT